MLIYIIGPRLFQTIVLGLFLQTIGFKYENTTTKRLENEDQSRQETA